MVYQHLNPISKIQMINLPRLKYHYSQIATFNKPKVRKFGKIIKPPHVMIEKVRCLHHKQVVLIAQMLKFILVEVDCTN